MDFMTWALSIATKHPELTNAMVNSNGEWLDILLEDGRSFRFRPGAMINPEASEASRTDILNRLISIGIAQALPPQEEPAATDPPALLSEEYRESELSATAEEPADTSTATAMDPSEIPDDSMVVPIVRAANYFLKSHNNGDSIVYIPLTDFIAVGLARDLDDSIAPVYYSHLGGDMRAIGEIMSEAAMNLRAMTGSQTSAIELAVAQIAGVRVMAFMRPISYEISWFCDLDMIHQVASHISAQRPDDIPLFVPASRTKLYVVFADDPNLADFFKILLKNRDDEEAVYPLPHTVAADGWTEWVPMPGDELSEVLGTLRNHFRAKIYADQVNAMHTWQEFGALKPFIPRRLKTGERVSVTEWDASDQVGSIPQTDFIVFTRSASLRPGEIQVPVSLTLRRRVAMEIWPEGFKKDEDAWPPRWEVSGFPDDETLLKLREATNRRF